MYLAAGKLLIPKSGVPTGEYVDIWYSFLYPGVPTGEYVDIWYSFLYPGVPTGEYVDIWYSFLYPGVPTGEYVGIWYSFLYPGVPTGEYVDIWYSFLFQCALDLRPQVIKFTSCWPTVGGSLRVLWLLPPLKLVAMI